MLIIFILSRLGKNRTTLSGFFLQGSRQSLVNTFNS